MVSKSVVLVDVPLERKPERGYIRMFSRNENRNEGTCSHVPPERKPERGYVCQNHPFTKPPFCLLVGRADTHTHTYLPASLVPGKAPGGTSRKFGGGFGRNFPEGGPDFLEVALVWKFPYGIFPKQTSKKFASEPPKLLRSPSEAVPCGSLS